MTPTQATVLAHLDVPRTEEELTVALMHTLGRTRHKIAGWLPSVLYALAKAELVQRTNDHADWHHEKWSKK